MVGEPGLEPTTPGLEVLSRPYPAIVLSCLKLIIYGHFKSFTPNPQLPPVSLEGPYTVWTINILIF
jgi:hypothetical protein